MQNHGLVICADTPEEIRTHTDWLAETLRKLLSAVGDAPAYGQTTNVDATAARNLIRILGPALRGLLATGENLKIVTFSDAPEVMALVAGVDGKAVATFGPITPDQIVYCKSFPLWFEPIADATSAQLVEQLRLAIQEHAKQTGSTPHVVLVKGLGMFSVGDDFAGADIVRLVYADIIKVMAGARKLGGVRYMNDGMRRFIEDWEVESYRKGITAAGRAGGRVAGKVAVVTGAARGNSRRICRPGWTRARCQSPRPARTGNWPRPDRPWYKFCLWRPILRNSLRPSRQPSTPRRGHRRAIAGAGRFRCKCRRARVHAIAANPRRPRDWPLTTEQIKR